MGKYKKLFSNTVAMGLGQFSSKLLSFLLVPLYTSVLSTEEYGTYDLIITTVTMLTPFLTLVISEAVMRFCMDKSYNPDKVLSVGVNITVLGTIILALFYPLLCKIESLNNEYAMWLVLFFFVINIHTIFTQYLKGVEKVVFYSVCGVISTILSLSLCIVFLLYFNWGIRGYFLSTVVSHVAVSLIIFIKERMYRKLSAPFKIAKETYKDMLRFSIPMIPNSVSWWLSNSASKYILLYFSTASAVGIYSVAYKIPSILSIVVTIFISAFQISIFENYGKKETEEFFKKIYDGFSAINMIVAAFLIVASKYIAGILYQKEFFSAWKASCIIIFAYVFHSLSALIGTIYGAAKETRFLFISTCIGAGINVVFSVLLIPKFDIEGAAISLVLSYFVVWVARVVNIKNKFKYKVGHIHNMFSIPLLIIQIVLAYIDNTFSMIGSCCLFIVIVVINVNPILKMDIVRQILNKLKKKAEKTEE